MLAAQFVLACAVTAQSMWLNGDHIHPLQTKSVPGTFSADMLGLANENTMNMLATCCRVSDCWAVCDTGLVVTPMEAPMAVAESCTMPVSKSSTVMLRRTCVAAPRELQCFSPKRRGGLRGTPGSCRRHQQIDNTP